MCTLNYLHEPAILYNLRQRFFAATPYTYTGDICVAVNPYRWIDGIYDVDKRQVDVDEDRKGLPPHVLHRVGELPRLLQPPSCQ